MKKRILSLVLATLLIASMAVPVSAAQYTYMDTYGSGYYEIVDNCYAYSYRSKMFYSSSEYSIYSAVTKYAVGKDNNNNPVVVSMGKVTSSPTFTYNEFSETVNFALHHIACEHFVGGTWVHTNTVNP